MLSYEQFIKELKTLNDGDWYLPHDHIIKQSWTTGGMTGGSCYVDQPNQIVIGDNPPEFFERFDEILEHFWPDIGHFQYKNVWKSVVESYDGKSNGGDYYGNHYVSAGRKFNLKNMYEYLCNSGKLPTKMKDPNFR